MSRLTVGRLFVYPVKSAAGIEVDQDELDEFGFRHDRRWMIIDREDRFLSQRSNPRMSLIRVRLEPETLRLEAAGMPDLELSRAPSAGAVRHVLIWKTRAAALDVGDEAAAWLSEFLDTHCRLVYMPRDVESGGRRFHAGRRLSFTDAYPFLIISAASLQELNDRLAEPLPMNRFRPNLVIEGARPHEEDLWHRVRIGEVEFEIVKPCARCSVTTVDQETGTRGVEPLRTLATYRRRDGKVLFGQNAVHLERGVVTRGDPVELLEITDRDPWDQPVRSGPRGPEAVARGGV